MVSLFSLGSGQYLYPNYYQLPAYPHPYSGGALGGPIAHQYSSFPGYSHYPAVAPSAVASERSGLAVPANIPQSRALLDGDLCPFSFIPIYGNTRVKGTLEKTGTYTVEGKICWWDVGDNSKFKLYIKGGALNKARLTVALATDCTGTATSTVEIVDVPEFGFGNGHYYVRENSNYNNAGRNGRTSITGKRLTIANSAGTIIGCTSAVLA